jgi:hypothetical protein
MTKLKKKHWLSLSPSLFFTSKFLPKGKTKMKNHKSSYSLGGFNRQKSEKGKMVRLLYLLPISSQKDRSMIKTLCFNM